MRNKDLLLNLIALILLAVLSAVFLALLGVSVCFALRAIVLPLALFVIAGGVIAGLCLSAAVFFFVRTRKRG